MTERRRTEGSNTRNQNNAMAQCDEYAISASCTVHPKSVLHVHVDTEELFRSTTHAHRATPEVVFQERLFSVMAVVNQP